MSKPRFGAHVDGTQPAIVRALVDVGAKVEVLDVSKAGTPDLLVGFLGSLYLLENKSKGGRLSSEQEREHKAWAAVGVKVGLARCPSEALAFVGATPEALAQRHVMLGRIARVLNPTARAHRALQSSVRRTT